MSPQRPWTRARLRDTMLRSFRQGHIRIRPASFDPTDKSATGRYEWADGRLHMDICIDAAQDGGLEVIVHELLHAHADDPDCPVAHGVLPREWGDKLRENALQGIEAGIVKHAKEHPHVFEEWRAAIVRKASSK